MATSSDQIPKNLYPSPPPYTVNATDSNNLSMARASFNELQQRINNGRGRNETKFLTLMQLGSIIILLLCALSCIIALHRNTKLMEQNLELLDKQLRILALAKNTNVDSLDITNYSSRVRRMIDPMDACPPCPTEAPPNPIEPHRNPVSVLNEAVGKKAKYETKWECQQPHIHRATLEIVDDPSFSGKSWNGKGRNQQNAKQSAAWEAIQNDLPHLIELVADEYKPPLYNPVCNSPTSALLTQYDEQ